MASYEQAYSPSSKFTGLAEHDVERIIRRAPDTYKTYAIDKRNGKGTREISQPAREVKILQKALVRRLSHLPIHDAAMAYRGGISIRANALKHAPNGPIRKYDFKDFFPSILSYDWEAYCRETPIFSDAEDIKNSANLFFHRKKGSSVLRLAIGAPSSPWLSNVLMYKFDDAIARTVAKDRVTYTRYADDLTFSAPRTGHLTVVDKVLRRIIHELESPRLRLNDDKTVVATTKYRRVVTGLILANSGEVSLGRDRKRLVRAMVHRALINDLEPVLTQKILGIVAHVRSVEPDFYHRLQAHYGPDFESRIRDKPLTL